LGYETSLDPILDLDLVSEGLGQAERAPAPDFVPHGPGLGNRRIETQGNYIQGSGREEILAENLTKILHY
jgi:hypothetical protein